MTSDFATALSFEISHLQGELESHQKAVREIKKKLRELSRYLEANASNILTSEEFDHD